MAQSLSEKIAARQNEIETQNADALKKQAESLRSVLKAEHETTLSVIRAQQRSLRASLRPVLWTTISCLVIVLAALALLSGGTRWKQHQLLGLMRQVEAQRVSLAEIEAKTDGLTVQKSSKGVFAILPSTADTSGFWTCGEQKQKCVKLRD